MANELQHRRSTAGQREDDREDDSEVRNPAPGEPRAPERQLTLGSATFNIQHLDKLIVLYYPPERDEDGQLLLPEV